jgi:hypothetical protein
MNLRPALFVAAFALTTVAGPAMAQFQPPPQQQEPPCMKDFSRLRDDAENKAKAVMDAQKRKVPLPEACKLLTALTGAQDKMLKYAKTNQTWCGIPPEIIVQMTSGQANASKARANVCRMAAAPQRPAGPSLSDALSAPIPDANNIKTGRGTFDTLTGTPLGSK